MRIGFKEFLGKYCKDIIRNYVQVDRLIQTSEFSYDGITTDEDGNEIRVIYIDGDSKRWIDIEDILGLERKDFSRKYKDPGALPAYDTYLSRVERVFGREACEMYRRAMAKINRRVEEVKTEGELISAGFFS